METAATETAKSESANGAATAVEARNGVTTDAPESKSGAST
jgi:hypothetical protein